MCVVALDDGFEVSIVVVSAVLSLDFGFLYSGVVVFWSFFFFFSSRRRHTRFDCDWSSDVCSSDLLNDMTLFGVGSVGIGGGQSGGTTGGRIGYGYLYPNFNAQVTYSSKSGRPAQLSIGLFQPSVLAGSAYDVTSIPRVEAEFTYNQRSGKNKYMFWAGGTWQSTKNAVTGGNTASSVGGTAGIRGDFSDLSVVVSGYIGKGLGHVLQFSGQEVAPRGTDLRKSDGG